MVFKVLRFILLLIFLPACYRSDQFDSNKVKKDNNIYPVVIIGGGVAGLTSSIYLAQANIKCLVLDSPEKQSAISQSHSVRNWPGEENISGFDLVNKIKNHAQASGASIVEQSILSVDFSVWPYVINVGSDEDLIKIRALSCIIAMGASPNFLNILGEKEYWGKGIGNCAVCDGSLYKDKIVGVVGGGDAAIEEAGYLSSLAQKVYIFVRKNEMRATGKVKDDIISKPNVEVLYNTEVLEIKGDSRKVTSVVLKNNKINEKKSLDVDCIFLAIGSKPNSQMFKKQLELDSNGYIVLKKEQETSKKGIFAAGDIANSEYKQAIRAAGQGCVAALQAQRFLMQTGYDIGNKSEERLKLTNRIQNKEDSSSKVIEISSKKELKKLTSKNDAPVVIDFYSSMCIPCQQMLPVVEKLATNFQDEVKFVKVNVSDSRSLAEKFDIQSVPTFVLVKNGKQVDKILGAQSEDSFVEKIKGVFQVERKT